MWFGPFPVRWNARHVNVDLLPGFTDIQEKGPMSHWQHTHTFTAITDEVTEIQDRIEYEYPQGWKGLWTRLLYAQNHAAIFVSVSLLGDEKGNAGKIIIF